MSSERDMHGDSRRSGTPRLTTPAHSLLDPHRIEILDPAVVEILRRKSPVERVEMVFAAERAMRLLLEAYLKTKHPDWDAGQIAREIARRRLSAAD